MAGTLSRGTWERVARLRRKRGYRNAATLGLVLLGPVLAALTFIVMGPLADDEETITNMLATRLRAIHGKLNS